MTRVEEMTEEQLREELQKIRQERAGKGRVKRAEAKGKRVSSYNKEKRVKQNAKDEAEAEFV